MMVRLFSFIFLTSFILDQGAFAQVSANTQLNQKFITSVMQKARVLKRSGGKTLGHIAQIFEKTAENLEDSDLYDLESRVIDWTLDVALRLRNVALMFRDVGMRASVAGDQVYNTSGSFHWGYYYAFWTRQFRYNYERRVATYDAGKFKFEQYNEIRTSGVRLRYELSRGQLIK